MKQEFINSNHTPEKQETSLTFRETFLKYLRYLPLFILSLAITISLTYFYLRYTTPLYNVIASLLIKNENNSAGGSEKFAEMFLFKSGGNIENEIEILHSNTLMKRVVKALELDTKYYAIGTVKRSNVYRETPLLLQVSRLADSLKPVKFHVKILDQNRYQLLPSKQTLFFNQAFENSLGRFKFIRNNTELKTVTYEEYLVTWQPIEEAASDLLEGLKIKPVNFQAKVLQLSFITDNKKMGEDVINQLMQEYNESSIEDKNAIALKTSNFINDRLKIISGELGDVEKGLQQFRQKNEVVNIEAQTGLFLENISDVNKQLQESEVQIAVIRLLEDYLKDQKNEFSSVSSSLGIEDPTFIKLATEYNALQLERERQVRVSTPDNPLVKQIEPQIEKLRLNLVEQLSNMKRSLELTKSQVIRKNNLYQSQVNSIPGKEKQLLEISRQQGIKQTLYLFLLQKREETAISLASTISNSKVVDPGKASKDPISPNRKNTYLLALALGLLIPVVIIYIRELMNDKVLTKTDIEKITSAPILGEVGHMEEKDQLLIAKKSDRNVISEQFRILRTNLQYIIQKQEKPVILVTSSFSGEGKSFITTNMGAVMALAGKKTVILEFDIRKPKIAAGLGLNKGVGITNYLVGNATLDELPVKIPQIDNLYVITCGPIPPNPADLLLSERLKFLFEYVKSNFDAVLIDTAPAGLVSDAIVLAEFVNCSLYIVRQRYTFKRQINLIRELYQNKRLPKLSIVVNDVKVQGTGYYGYGNYGGYGYGYGYGANELNGNGSKKKGLIQRIKSTLNF